MRIEVDINGNITEHPDLPVVPLTTEELTAIRIAQIKNELAAIDAKRIRPVAEGDTEYLATLNAQAVALRAELQGLMVA